MSTSKPQVLNWITCDGVHMDPSTGKYTLLGLFSALRARQFPVNHPLMFWFLTVSEVPAGKHKLRISMGLEADKSAPLIEREFESPGAQHPLNLINEVRNLSFPAAGDYAITIELDEQVLLTTHFSVSN